MAYFPYIDLSGCKLDLQAGPTWCFSDDAGTTPAAVGDRVATWKDRTSGLNHATQTTNLLRGILRQDANGLYYVEIVYDLSNNTGYATGLTLASGAQCIAFAASQDAADYGAINSRIINATSGNSLLTLARDLSMHVGGSFVCFTAAETGGTLRSMIGTKAGGGGFWSYSKGGTSIPTTNITTHASNSNDFGAINIAASGQFGEGFNGRLYGVVAAESNPTGASKTALKAYLTKLYSPPQTIRIRPTGNTCHIRPTGNQTVIHPSPAYR